MPTAGYAFCGIAALSLLDRPYDTSMPRKFSYLDVIDRPALVHWLASRPFAYLTAPEDVNEDDAENDNFHLPSSLAALSLEENLSHVGFNGRCNKVADTCYCWWVGGCLSILGQKDQLPRPASRRFLIEKTQHLIGGFAKYPGGPPDIYHAFLGLAALSVMDEPGLKSLDPAPVLSTDTVRKVEAGRKGLLALARGGSRHDAEQLLSISVDLLGREAGWSEAGTRHLAPCG